MRQYCNGISAILAVTLLSFVFLFGAISCVIKEPISESTMPPTPTLSPSLTGNSSVPDQSPGAVSITYTLNHISKIASNQIAVWIEDQNRKYICTLYATRFTASGGYKQRPEALPLWIGASDWKNASKSEVDAVTGATQKPGVNTLTWDCRDKEGQPVKPGKYVYIMEGNIYWNDRVVWRGEIEVGSKESTSLAKVSYIPETAKDSGVLIENVSAVFKPRR